VGGALLACTLGPAAASVVMMAILAIQALVFQDGGILALGANVFNMAIAGVFAGYLPYYLWGRGRTRRAAIFAAGALSVAVSALLAVGELMISGVRMPTSVLGVSLGLFAVSAVIEGAITMAVLSALEAIQPNFARPAAEPGRRYALAAVAVTALLFASAATVVASRAPDGIARLALDTGIASQARTWMASPLRDYQAGFLGAGWPAQAGAGVLGVAMAGGLCVLIGRKR